MEADMSRKKPHKGHKSTHNTYLHCTNVLRTFVQCIYDNVKKKQPSSCRDELMHKNAEVRQEKPRTRIG